MDMDFLWDFYQHPMIPGMDQSEPVIDNKTTDLSLRTTHLTSTVKQLETSIERLTLINRALWEIIHDRLDVSEEDLKDKVNEIDLRDGILDGKFRKKEVRKCLSCGRTLLKRHQKCMYCGSEDFHADIFDGVI